MKTPERVSLRYFISVCFSIVTFVAVLITACSMAQATPTSQELKQLGSYLALAGDCIACHTSPEGQAFAGGLALDTPLGMIYSTNITPDLETGIGRYSIEDFVKVMHEGVAMDGHRLYPAMPYSSYAKVSREDLLPLYTYFMQGVEPVHNPNHPTQLSWPLSMRSLMAVWNALYLKKGEYVANPDKSASWNRGAYLVQGLGHCGECHTPRGFVGQMKAYNEKNGKHYLAGATLDNWHAAPLTGDPETGLNAWSQDEIVEYLRTGRTVRVAAVGAMAAVVGKSTQYLTDNDLMAIAEYLKSLPPSNYEGPDSVDSVVQASPASAATHALRAGDTGTRGSLVYLDNCNACHRSDGSGASRTFVNLVKNEVVNSKDPISLIHIVIAGSAMPSTKTAPTAFAMPDFGWRLSDAEIAEVLSFIRSSWGNHAAEVSPNDVGRVRKALEVQKTAR